MGNKGGNMAIQVSTSVFDRLTRQDYRAFLAPVFAGVLLAPISRYQGDFIALAMQRWIDQQKCGEDLAMGAGLLNRAQGLYGAVQEPPVLEGLAGLLASRPGRRWF
jgi:hypothetical protein